MRHSIKSIGCRGRTKSVFLVQLAAALITGALFLGSHSASSAMPRGYVGTVTQYQGGEEVDAVSFYLNPGYTTHSAAASSACRSVGVANKGQLFLSGHITLRFIRAGAVPAPITSDIEPFESTQVLEAARVNGTWVCNPSTSPTVTGTGGETVTIPFITDGAPSKEWLPLYKHDLEFKIGDLTRGQFTLAGATAAECPTMPYYANPVRLAYFARPPYYIAVRKPAVKCQTISDQQQITTATTGTVPPPTTTTIGNSGNS